MSPDLSRYQFIAIEGNIGSGKTTLANLMAERYRAKLILEEFADNPFLPQFYRHPERYSFVLEMSFLAERYQQLKNQLTSLDLFHQLMVSDYLFYKCLIFAKANLDKDEFTLYNTLFNIIEQALPKPDLLVYLYVDLPRLKDNIRKRGRSYEQEITDEYLQRIQDSYFDFFQKHPQQRTLIIETTEIDFLKRPEDFERILEVMAEDHPEGVSRILLE
ncbi:MAG: deoxynucleoside kinase [Salibacteraceae bacterium]